MVFNITFQLLKYACQPMKSDKSSSFWESRFYFKYKQSGTSRERDLGKSSFNKQNSFFSFYEKNRIFRELYNFTAEYV